MVPVICRDDILPRAQLVRVLAPAELDPDEFLISDAIDATYPHP